MFPHRIALCITDLDVGGAELCLVELATRLDRTRFIPVVYCLGPEPDARAASCVPRLEAAGIEFHCLGGRRWRDFPQVLSHLRCLLERHRPALIQTFLFHANLLGRLAARRAKVPRVVSGIRVAERRSGWHLWLDRLTAGKVDRYVCVSQSVARFSASRGRLPPEKLVVIPNAIDARQYRSLPPADMREFGIPPQSGVVTYVGRLDRQKGLAWLLESAPVWLDRLPDCHLLLVGKGPERSRLESLRDRLSLGPRVHFAGWRPDIPAILAASRLLVLPSRWEGMPNSVLQAMAAGLPVVATDVEGVRELLGEDAGPQTIPYGDSQVLSEALVRLFSDPAAAAELGRRNHLRAETAFTFDRMVAAYGRLWESLIEGRADC